MSIVAIAREGTDVLITGSANLPDGARLRCGLWRGGWDGPFDGISYADAHVDGGRFTCRFEPSTELTGAVSASVELRADRSQPLRVQDVIGPKGERLAYSDTVGSDYSQVFVVETTDLR